MTLHERLAVALGWTVAQTQSFSLSALREMMQPVSPKLVHEVTIAMKGLCLTTGEESMSLAEQMQKRTQDARTQLAQEEEKKVQVLMQTLKPLMDAAADEGYTYVEVLGKIDPDLFNYLGRERFKVGTSEVEGNPAYCVRWDDPSALPHTVQLVLASRPNELRQHIQKAKSRQDPLDVGKRLRWERLLLLEILTLLADQSISEVALEFKDFSFYEETLREMEDLGIIVQGPAVTASSNTLGGTYRFQWV